MNNITLFKIPALVLAAALTACGGGGTDAGAGAPATPTTPTTPAAPAVKLADAQGFWSATASATSSASAVILPNGQAWVVYQTGGAITALAQATLSLNGATFTSVGKHYSLPAGAVQDYNFSGNLTVAGAGTLTNSVTIGSGTPAALTWTYNKTYETPAVPSSVQGRWSGKQGADSLVWDIDAAGSLAGTSTTGCTYGGTITPNANPVAVLDVAIGETCAGASKTLTGIATLNAAKTGMSLAYTTGAGTQGGVVVLAK